MKTVRLLQFLFRFHSFGGKSKVSDLVKYRKNGSNTSLPEMINKNQTQYDSSSAVSLIWLTIIQLINRLIIGWWIKLQISRNFGRFAVYFKTGIRTSENKIESKIAIIGRFWREFWRFRFTVTIDYLWKQWWRLKFVKKTSKAF